MLRTRLACDVELVTVSVAVAELGEAWLPALTIAVSEMGVPSAVPALTV